MQYFSCPVLVNAGYFGLRIMLRGSCYEKHFLCVCVLFFSFFLINTFVNRHTQYITCLNCHYDLCPLCFNMSTCIYAAMERLVISYIADCVPFGIICSYE